MKLGVMPGDTLPATELKTEGFDAMQLFWGAGDDAPAKDPEPEKIAATLAAGNLDLAAMTLHIDLVGPRGRIDADVERTIDLVGRTAALDIHKGDNPRSILVWHPSGYPKGEGLDDRAIFDGLCSALTDICRVAESSGIDIAIEITRNGSVGSAETFLHLIDRVGSSALKACIDAANFCPDRTPLVRAVRSLAPYTVIAHGKDCSFKDNGEPDTYGPTGSGRLDYDTYIQSLLEFAPEVPYFVLEYYKSRDDLLRARDIVQAAMAKGSH
ncbi:MAG: TIM barrel protein [bacterium]|nr:TIM barrel protein [bacterium]